MKIQNNLSRLEAKSQRFHLKKESMTADNTIQVYMQRSTTFRAKYLGYTQHQLS